jgi:hypothetical protein
MTDYNALMQMLLGASPVANVAFDPYKKGINPMQATEGAMPYRGGANPRTTVTPEVKSEAPALKAGSSIKTDKGERIRLSGEPPHWNDYHQKWYAWGNRWIKSKGAWSGTGGLHNFSKFEADGE